MFDPVLKKAPRVNVDPDATESETETKNDKIPKASFVKQEDGATKELEEYLTFGELAGRIPTSLIPKIDFQKFVKSNKLPVMEENAVKSIQPAPAAAAETEIVK